MTSLRNFPRLGDIRRAYAKQKDEPGEYHGAVEYLINATGANDESPGFPMAYGKFTEAAYISTARWMDG